MKNVCIAVVALAFASSVATADTITVCLDGSCDYTGIQEAINAASDGDVIEIAAGTYYPAATIDTIGKAVTLRGVPGKGKDDAPTTVIDGQDTIRVLICENGEGADTVFENLLIRGGSASCGGGMRNSGSSPTLVNCRFEGNSADYDCDSDYGYGGGMLNSGGSNPTLTDCTFEGNSADYGGGMYNSNESSPTLAVCTFTNNSADYDGGGLHCNSNSSPTLSNCVFELNSARNWLHISTTQDENPIPAGCGGGICLWNSSTILINCLFTENSSSDGAGIMCGFGSNPTLTGCTFTGNAGYRGGGMNNWSSNLTLINCTFTGNSAWSGGGGGMYNYSSSPTLASCTFTECCQVVPPNSFIDKGGNDYDSWCDECRADVDCDNEVNAADLGLLLSAWNTTEAQYDIDGNGVVGGGDLGMLLGTWGACP